MKHKLLATIAALAIAASLNAAYAVRTQPDDSAPVIATLENITPQNLTHTVTTPAGWTAVNLPGPHTVYLLGQDIQKSGDTRPGAPYYTQADATSPVLATAEPTDSTEPIDLLGKWTQLKLNKNIIGFIKGTLTATTQTTTTATTTTTYARPQQQPQQSAPTQPHRFLSDEPVAQAQQQQQQPARQAQQSSPISPAPESAPAQISPAPETVITPYAAGTSSAASDLNTRVFKGTLARTKVYIPFTKPRYPYQILDLNGKHLAYLDLSAYRNADRIDAYIGASVIIQGSPSNTDKGDMLIQVDSLSPETRRR